MKHVIEALERIISADPNHSQFAVLAIAEAKDVLSALHNIATYCEAEPQSSSQAIMAKMARYAIRGKL